MKLFTKKIDLGRECVIPKFHGLPARALGNGGFALGARLKSAKPGETRVVGRVQVPVVVRKKRRRRGVHSPPFIWHLRPLCAASSLRPFAHWCVEGKPPSACSLSNGRAELLKTRNQLHAPSDGER